MTDEASSELSGWPPESAFWVTTTSSNSVPLEPEPEPPVRLPRVGMYQLEQGDTPAIVARRLFGRGSLAGALVAANPGATWRAGEEINVKGLDDE